MSSLISALYIAVCVLSAVSGVFAVTRHYQMLQQNSYYPKRYMGWFKESGVKAFFAGALFFVICSILLNDAGVFVIAPAMLIYTVITVISAVKKQKKSIKKLVFTARIKRMYFCLILIFAVCILLEVLCGLHYFTAFALLLACVPFFANLLTWTIMKPFENAVTKHYIKDSKKILASYGDRIKVVGITGSYGKTGTKFILSRILSEKYNVTATPQSFNTPMGVVRTVRENLKNETEVFICEMGAKNIGDIKEICDIAHPTTGIITSVGPQHLETFKTVENVLATKFELADAVNTTGGKVYINGDNKFAYTRGDEGVLYGTDPSFPFYCDNMTCSESGESFDLHLRGEIIRVTTKLLGTHSALNITGAAALAYDMGVAAKDIRFAVSRLEPVEHRLEMKPFMNGSVLIDDAYNANPEGCIEAVNVLSRFENKKKVIVTPGLVELGEKEYDYNYALGLAAAQKCDIIILVGKERSVPMSDAVATTDFDKNNLFVVDSFKEAMSVYSRFADGNTAVLFENDLPDNYIK